MKFIDLFPIAIGTQSPASLTPDVIRRAIELIDGSEQIDSGADGMLTRDQLTGGSSLSIANPHFLDIFGFMPRIIDNDPRSWGAYLVKPEPGTIGMVPSASETRQGTVARLPSLVVNASETAR